MAFKAENGQLVKTQSADYDAFGYEYNKTEQAQNNNYKYQKQERIDDFNLGIDFFKYRPSDFIIGRFWQIDPLAEQFMYNSPYALQENKFGLGIELEGAELATFKAVGNVNKQEQPNWSKIISNVLSFTDFNDATVLSTTITRGSNAINLDGSKATATDKSFALAGAFIPVVSGATLKKVVGVVSDKVADVLNTISDLKKSGTEIKVNPLKAVDKQELNMTFKNKDGSKLDLRIETHEIPKSLGGKGDVPQRHLNADVYNSSGNRVKMKHINGGHKVLE